MPIYSQLLYFTILVIVWAHLFHEEEPFPSIEAPEETLEDSIITFGEKFLGTPYKFGSNPGQTDTFDCSSFVQYVFNEYGISLPRTSRQQSALGITIPRERIQKGDLLFFKSSSSDGAVRHVGIYAGNDLVLHISGSKGVHYQSLSHSLFDKMYLFAKRVII